MLRISIFEKDNSDWKALWKLKTPAKGKLFAWKAARNILPVRESLINKTAAARFEKYHTQGR